MPSSIAVAGIRNVHTAWRPTKRPLPATRAAPNRPTQVTRPPWTTAPVSERAACSRIANGLPAAGLAGIVEKFRTLSRAGAVFTS